MIKVRKLDGPPYEKLQCQLPKEELDPGTIGWKGYRETRSRINSHDPNFCMRHALWEVNGRKLCTQHAGIEVLEHFAEQEPKML